MRSPGAPLTRPRRRWTTALAAVGPLAATPLVVWLLMEYGPERSAVFAVYWLVWGLVFAILYPVARRRGRGAIAAALTAVAVALVGTFLLAVIIFFAFTPS